MKLQNWFNWTHSKFDIYVYLFVDTFPIKSHQLLRFCAHKMINDLFGMNVLFFVSESRSDFWNINHYFVEKLRSKTQICSMSIPFTLFMRNYYVQFHIFIIWILFKSTLPHTASLKVDVCIQLIVINGIQMKFYKVKWSELCINRGYQSTVR